MGSTSGLLWLVFCLCQYTTLTSRYLFHLLGNCRHGVCHGNCWYFTRSFWHELDLLVPRYELRLGSVLWPLYQSQSLCRLPSHGHYPWFGLAPGAADKDSGNITTALAASLAPLVWALIDRTPAVDPRVVFNGRCNDPIRIAWWSTQLFPLFIMFGMVTSPTSFTEVFPSRIDPKSCCDGGHGDLAWCHAASEAF